MNDLQLFRGMTRLIPLEPIADAETYYRACEIQDENRESDDPAVKLYVQALTLFMTAYEDGYRPDE
jgi:hypothetical protein